MKNEFFSIILLKKFIYSKHSEADEIKPFDMFMKITATDSATQCFLKFWKYFNLFPKG